MSLISIGCMRYRSTHTKPQFTSSKTISILPTLSNWLSWLGTFTLPGLFACDYFFFLGILSLTLKHINEHSPLLLIFILPPTLLCSTIFYSHSDAYVWNPHFIYLFYVLPLCQAKYYKPHSFPYLFWLWNIRIILHCPLWYSGTPTWTFHGIIYPPVHPVSGGGPWGSTWRVGWRTPYLTLSRFHKHVHNYFHLMVHYIDQPLHFWYAIIHNSISQSPCISWRASNTLDLHINTHPTCWKTYFIEIYSLEDLRATKRNKIYSWRWKW